MAENSIEQVRNAETEAEEIAKKASAQAEEIIALAQDKAEKLHKDTEDEIAGNTAAELNAARTAGQAQLQKAQAGLSGELEALADRARKAQPKAVQLIVDALV